MGLQHPSGCRHGPVGSNIRAGPDWRTTPDRYRAAAEIPNTKPVVSLPDSRSRKDRPPHGRNSGERLRPSSPSSVTKAKSAACRFPGADTSGSSRSRRTYAERDPRRDGRRRIRSTVGTPDTAATSAWIAAMSEPASAGCTSRIIEKPPFPSTMSRSTVPGNVPGARILVRKCTVSALMGPLEVPALAG